MSAQLGFVLLTHQNPEQILFVCGMLQRRFPGAIVALHHDFGQCDLNRTLLPDNIRLVEDWIPTAWGKFSQVAAYLKALRLLHDIASPSWIFNLSANDYPVKPTSYILKQLEQSEADVYLDFQDLFTGEAGQTDGDSAKPFHTARWRKSAIERYVAIDILPFRIRKHIGMRNRTVYVRNQFTTRLLTPFNEIFHPYAGDVWHAINGRAAQVLLREDEKAKALQHCYRRKAMPDESYYQTILLNEPTLKVCGENRRFTIWEPGAPSPRALTATDIPAMLRSSAHFARKFPYNQELYAELENELAAWDEAGSDDVQRA